MNRIALQEKAKQLRQQAELLKSNLLLLRKDLMQMNNQMSQLSDDIAGARQRFQQLTESQYPTARVVYLNQDKVISVAS